MWVVGIQPMTLLKKNEQNIEVHKKVNEIITGYIQTKKVHILIITGSL